jgi:excisionase family DNA binding protein
MLMRAAVLTEFGAALEIREVDIADPGPGEVRVRIKASGVCGSDIKALDGKSPVVRQLPFVLGHESAGIVESTGAGVTGVRPGDHVIIAMNGACGRCRNCGGGRFHLCGGPARTAAIMGTMRDGTTRIKVDGADAKTMIGIGSFAEYAVVNEPMCVKIDRRAPFDTMCLLACGVITGVGAVLNVAGVTPLDKKQLAEHLKLTVRTIENWQRRGALPYVKVGKVVLFHWPDVVEHLRKNFRVCRA